MLGNEQLGKQPVEQLELAAHSEQIRTRFLGRIDGNLDLLEDVRVVADLSQLHDGVLQTRIPCGLAFFPAWLLSSPDKIILCFFICW